MAKPKYLSLGFELADLGAAAEGVRLRLERLQEPGSSRTREEVQTLSSGLALLCVIGARLGLLRRVVRRETDPVLALTAENVVTEVAADDLVVKPWSDEEREQQGRRRTSAAASGWSAAAPGMSLVLFRQRGLLGRPSLPHGAVSRRQEQVNDRDLQEVGQLGHRVEGQVLSGGLDPRQVRRRDLGHLRELGLGPPPVAADLRDPAAQVLADLLGAGAGHDPTVRRGSSFKNILLGGTYSGLGRGVATSGGCPLAVEVTMRSRASRAVLSVFLLVVAAGSGCATVKEKRTVIDGRQDRKIEVGRSAFDPPRAELTAGKDGALVLVLAQTPRCIERMLVVTAQEARVEREAVGDGWFDGKTWYLAPAGVGLLGGVWTALGVAGATATPPPGQVIDQNRVTANLAFGIGALLVAGTWTGIELYRLRTTVEPMEPRRGGETKEVACNPAPVVRAQVTLTLNGTTLLTETTDERGEVRVNPERLTTQVQQVARELRAVWFGQTQQVKVNEEVLWLLATQTPAGAGYRAYLAAFPDGVYRNDAQQALAEVEEEKKASEWRITAAAARDEAERLFKSGDLAAAWESVTKALAYGGEVDALIAKISDARAKKGKEHLASAWRLVRRDRPDQASAQYARAVALGAVDEGLATAIEKTPTARRRQRQSEREQARLALEAQERSSCIPLMGEVVQRVGPKTYEIAVDSMLLPGQRALLRTTKTTFDSARRFFVTARLTGKKNVALKNGFDDTWEVWTECPAQ